MAMTVTATSRPDTVSASLNQFLIPGLHPSMDGHGRLRGPFFCEGVPTLVADGPQLALWLLRDPRLNPLDERLQIGLADRPLFFMTVSALS